MEKEKEIENLKEEVKSLENHLQKVNQENNKRFGQNIELNREIGELKRKYNKLELYTKHIQEYLLKDIFELMDEDDDE